MSIEAKAIERIKLILQKIEDTLPDWALERISKMESEMLVILTPEAKIGAAFILRSILRILGETVGKPGEK